MVEYELPKLGVAGSNPVVRSFFLFSRVVEKNEKKWDCVLTFTKKTEEKGVAS